MSGEECCGDHIPNNARRYTYNINIMNNSVRLNYLFIKCGEVGLENTTISSGYAVEGSKVGVRYSITSYLNKNCFVTFVSSASLIHSPLISCYTAAVALICYSRWLMLYMPGILKRLNFKFQGLYGGEVPDCHVQQLQYMSNVSAENQTQTWCHCI